MSQVCGTCPIGDENGWSEEAEQAIGLGCLPCLGEALEIKIRTGANWGCHSEARICAGFVRECRERGIEYRNSPTLDYAIWANQGEETALRAAGL